MTRYFYDTEFLEDGSTIDLLSIGIVADDGREFYAVNGWANWQRARADAWLAENVIPHLGVQFGRKHARSAAAQVSYDLAKEVFDFLAAGDSTPELWAWYAAYDHVALCQLAGRMVDLPGFMPMFTNDLKSIHHLFAPALVLPVQVGTVHNALEDARHLAAMHARVFEVLAKGRL